MPILAGTASFGFVDILAYVGGLWFFFACILVGPIIRSHISAPKLTAELGRHLFFRTPNDSFNPDKRVKIGSS